jgi:hypothetical protein
VNNTKRQLRLAFNIIIFSFKSPLLHYIISYVSSLILSRALRLIGFSVNPATCRSIMHIILFVTCSPARAPWLSIYAMATKDEPSEPMPIEELIQLVLAFRRMLYYVAASLCLQNLSSSVALLRQLKSHLTFTFVALKVLPFLRGPDSLLKGLRWLCGLSLQDTIWKGYPLIQPYEYLLLGEEDYFVIWSNAILTTLDLATWPPGKVELHCPRGLDTATIEQDRPKHGKIPI